MWLQAPLRDHWAQGVVDLYEIGLTLRVENKWEEEGAAVAKSRRKFFPNTDDETFQRSWGTHPPPPIPFERSFLIWAPKFKFMAPKFKYVAPRLKYVAPKFKYLTPNSNKLNFVPLNPSRFVQRKTFNSASLTHAQPLMGLFFLSFLVLVKMKMHTFVQLQCSVLFFFLWVLNPHS